MIDKHGPRRSLQGLSGVGIVCVGRDIPELCALFCGCVNSNGILCSQEHPLLNQQGSLDSFPPFKLMGDLCVPFRLQLLLPLFFFFFFCGLLIWFGWIM